MSLATGEDAVLDDVWSYQQYNRFKNHWVGASAPANAVAGMIWSDSDDDKLYHYTGAAWQEIAQIISGVLSVGTAAIAGSIKVYDGSDHYFSIAAQAQAGNTAYTWPAAFPASSKFLQCTDAGVLSWETPA